MPVDRDRHRARLLRFTRKAFALLPRREWRRAVDLGCGSGAATVEVVHLTGGVVVALDREPTVLAALQSRVEAIGGGERVLVVRGDLTALPFQSGAFDLAWAEGSIFALGFDEALRRWRALLAAGGFLVVHDAAEGLERKVAQVARCGFELLGVVDVPGQAWWEGYYLPLLAEAEDLAAGGDPARCAELADIRREAGNVETASERMHSVFLLMRRPE